VSRTALAYAAESAAPARSSVAGSFAASTLRINRPGDFYEQEADRAADQVVSNAPTSMSTRKPAWSLSRVGLQAPLQRQCTCGGECPDCTTEKMLQREASGAASHAVAPPIVHSVLGGAGRQLDPSTRSFMESRFGHDFSRVRIFNDGAAAKSAQAVSANAYTVGEKIVFNQGRYAPGSAAGKRLLAHELAHVVQQQSAPHFTESSPHLARQLDSSELQGDAGAVEPPATQLAVPKLTSRAPQPMLQRLSYAELKEDAYKAMIETARTATQATIALLRKGAALLPAILQPAANDLIGIADFIIGGNVAIALAVVGILVGAGEGVVDMVRGLVTLVLGTAKVLFDVISGIFNGFDAAKQDFNAIWEALKGLPGAVKNLVTGWLDRFSKASSERQSLMIGELTGQIIALIGTWALAAGRAGTAAKLGAGATDAAATAGDVVSTAARATAPAAADAATTAAKAAAPAARPALRAIEGGGQAAAARSATGSVITKGGAVRSLAPAVEEASKFVPRIVPPPPVTAPLEAVPAAATITPTVAAASRVGTDVAAGAAVGAVKATQVAKDAADDKKKKKCEDAQPCGVLPIIWPAALLPEPEDADLVRTKADLREVEGTDRGPNQQDFSRCIRKWKDDPKHPDLESECPDRGFYQDGLQPSEPIDAHHLHPLYLGGGDDWPGNLGALETMRHRKGHAQLDNQQHMFDTDPTWAACNVCSPRLSKHPVDQEYSVEPS
jgi:Domain of unknown function (DUF4157)